MQVYVVLNHQTICTRNGNYSYKTLPICSASIALTIRSEVPAKSVLFFFSWDCLIVPKHLGMMFGHREPRIRAGTAEAPIRVHLVSPQLAVPLSFEASSVCHRQLS